MFEYRVFSIDWENNQDSENELIFTIIIEPCRFLNLLGFKPKSKQIYLKLKDDKPSEAYYYPSFESQNFDSLYRMYFALKKYKLKKRMESEYKTK